MKPLSKSAANFLHALVAVLAGNAIYFLVEKYLPARAHHAPFKIDLGMVVDFWFCLVVFGIIKTVAGWRRESKLHKP
jgi:cytosine/uracil/thiamine/allantoin permease